MCNTPTQDVERTVSQILRLEQAGCQIIRVAVPDMDAARAIGPIRRRIHIPWWRISTLTIAWPGMRPPGVDKIRINPGNIGSAERSGPWQTPAGTGAFPSASASTAAPWSGSCCKKYGGVTAQALVDSALGHVRLLNDCNFDDICISVKCSHVPVNMAAYRMLHEQTDYPLHLGVTEAGTPAWGC